MTPTVLTHVTNSTSPTAQLSPAPSINYHLTPITAQPTSIAIANHHHPTPPPRIAQPLCPTINSHHHYSNHLNSSNYQQSINQQLPLSNIAIHFPLPSPTRKPCPRHQLSLLHCPTEHGSKYQLSPPQHTSYRSLATASPHHSTAQPSDRHRHPQPPTGPLCAPYRFPLVTLMA